MESRQSCPVPDVPDVGQSLQGSAESQQNESGRLSAEAAAQALQALPQILLRLCEALETSNQRTQDLISQLVRIEPEPEPEPDDGPPTVDLAGRPILRR